MAAKGTWARVQSTVLEAAQRTAAIPEDTKKTDLTMWVKGHLLADAEIGDICEVETVTGRTVKGKLIEVNSRYTHDFGEYVPEIDYIKFSVRSALEVRE